PGRVPAHQRGTVDPSTRTHSSIAAAGAARNTRFAVPAVNSVGHLRLVFALPQKETRRYKPASHAEIKEKAMKWASLLVCALGSTLVLVTGCDTIGIGAGVALSAVDAVGDVRVVDGSPQTVAISMAAML